MYELHFDSRLHNPCFDRMDRVEKVLAIMLHQHTEQEQNL